MNARKGFSYGLYSPVPGKAILIVLLVLLADIPASAQQEANNWLFGDKAGLDFSSGTPAALAGSQMTTNEGSAVMSDQNGHLLFYTNGVTVWNKNHQPMPNGTGLLGHSSATQSAIIVPWPGKACQKYFVFTVGAVDNNVNVNLSYSLVDMTLAGGLGDVVAATKNIVLKNRVSEKLTAVRDAQGTGFWVIAHGFDLYAQPSTIAVSGEFYAFHVDSSGINTSPTVSTAGTPHTWNYSWGVPSQGQMKVSPDGKLIACAVRSKFVEILNFDNATGQVSGPAKTFSTSSPPFQTIYVYGLEFSPNSKLLYVTTTGGSPNQLLQLDFTATTPAWTQLFSSTGTGNYYDTGELQLGPDKKIYVARYNKNYLSVIDSPNISGPGSNFINAGPTLPPLTFSRLGLPTIISGDFSCTGIVSTPQSEGCCDSLTAVPFGWKPKATLELRSFTITNTKVPASPICSIDISFNPSVPTMGSLISIDGVSVPPTPPRFVAPYNKIPNGGAPTISALSSLNFTLAVSYSPVWTGTVTFVVNHCDKSTCTLTYGPWTSSPPPPQAAAPARYVSTLKTEGRFSTLSFQLLQVERRRPVKWISFSIDETQGQLFAGRTSAANEGQWPLSPEVRVEDGGLTGTSILYAFAQPLKSGEISRPFELLLSRAPNATGPVIITWTIFDPNGNAIEAGKISSQPDIFNK